MPYLNTDDGFPEHPKVDSLSDSAYRLHSTGMHYCARHLTDGLIPADKVSRLKPNYKPNQLAELLRGKLWHKGGEGCGTEHCPTGSPGEYVVHDYLQWNRPRAWWDARREAETQRKADYRARKAAEEAEAAQVREGLRSV